ncbi:hypothetical protein P9D39_23360 [Heyndrickxia oleronia]|nr:hypothetical protein [Heyndrickxia oleronia]MBU5210262.1 hypothetical protein [Heyndrickxia oleronia]MEC1377217.1 hypothetical protein [Heyndrickxia oleronia]QQZ07059.1 hypothetical protein I5818_11995 [Heyndrickxia oleronia]
MYINIILEYKIHLSMLEDEIEVLTKSIEEMYDYTIHPRNQKKVAATIISEIGEIDRFNHPKKLVALEESIQVSLNPEHSKVL